MTRTARATYPRAALKDRSQSRSGLDKSLKKNGAGKGNWGTLGDVGYDEEFYEEEASENLSVSEEGSEASSPLEPKPSMLDGKDVEAARAFRKRALSGTVDLSTIARTSVAVSGSPPKA
ncbi:hypothetical protein BT96DRAFT_931535 [Gymnopus androsaceus JB14]|uniref:Hyaluronan/mRNA-binding protein domain-containing protein n=1 Tax=Gymnopus androsaceus JB14 TaxID=1447944 RepID=A0A6A4IHH4_9AGAR|nr:hypothetical protein BT96DRAFT_931535 [Gymnopus androsaceus JB14]